MIELLDHWQTLSGAVIGGLMGFVGAWLVASSASARDRRSAARMLIMSLQQCEAVYRQIKLKDSERPAAVTPGAWIAAQLVMFRMNIPQDFEQQTSRVAHVSAHLTAYLTTLAAVARRLGVYADAVVKSKRGSAGQSVTTESYDERTVVADFERLHILAVKTIYWLLPEVQSWWWPRYAMKRDRYVIPTEEDKAMKVFPRSLEEESSR